MVDIKLGAQLAYKDVEYVADMLRAIVWVKEDLCGVTDQTLAHLSKQLNEAEKVLREVVEQMKAHRSSF